MSKSSYDLTKGVTPYYLRTEWLKDPLGVDVVLPRLSWQLRENSGRSKKQSAYRILAASTRELLDQNIGDKWDSGKIKSDETLQIVYGGASLKSGEEVFWKIRTWDEKDDMSVWSDVAKWSMGWLHPDNCHAKWISCVDSFPLHRHQQTLFLPPARYYRKSFKLSRPVKRAVVYVSALGLFDLYLNGKRVGDSYFQPGWSDYRQRAYYRTFDVTLMLESGFNSIGVVLADGWYSGYVGFGAFVGYGPNKSGRYFYGKTPALLFQLEVEYSDGSREEIVSDQTWEVSQDGPIREADILMGETFDARRHCVDWAQNESHAKSDLKWSWQLAIEAETLPSCCTIFRDALGEREVDLKFRKPARLQSYMAPPVRVTQELRVQKITDLESGAYILDFGQNFSGLVRTRFKGRAGQCVQLRYGEMLHQDGQLMIENLRRARATDTYIFAGIPEGEEWSPRFTYHGFQYVEISGLDYKPSPGDITGLVLHSDTPFVGEFACSDPVLTKFSKNAFWTQRSNFFEIPTDCPQRDERLGWTADAQVFIRAATYRADVAAFFNKWMDDVREAQLPYGAYPDYCPFPMAHGKAFSTAWSDAGIICPWTVWKVYGDTRVIEKQWESMSRFMEWRDATSAKSGLGTSIGNLWGDWLNAGESTPIEYIDICYHAFDCKLMSEMASVLGKKIEENHYKERFKKIRSAFQEHYLADHGKLKVNTQTAYALALCFDLISAEQSPETASHLAQKIRDKELTMTTGFLGTRFILPALTAHGQHPLAVQLFQSRNYPSWAYEVLNGATSVWERWDSYTEQYGFDGLDGKQNAGMNSFSHYAFGAVMEWAFRDLAGIDTDGEGYRRILIKPGFVLGDLKRDPNRIHWVKADYHSVRGLIQVTWRQEDDSTDLEVTIPPNTTARIFMPAKDEPSILEGGRPLSAAEGISVYGRHGCFFVLQTGSGHFSLSSKKYR